jgi:hypothetical protein
MLMPASYKFLALAPLKTQTPITEKVKNKNFVTFKLASLYQAYYFRENSFCCIRCRSYNLLNNSSLRGYISYTTGVTGSAAEDTGANAVEDIPKWHITSVVTCTTYEVHNTVCRTT